MAFRIQPFSRTHHKWILQLTIHPYQKQQSVSNLLVKYHHVTQK